MSYVQIFLKLNISYTNVVSFSCAACLTFESRSRLASVHKPSVPPGFATIQNALSLRIT